MKVSQVVELLQSMPQHIELVVYNLCEETEHKTVGVHVYPTQGVVAINVTNRPKSLDRSNHGRKG